MRYVDVMRVLTVALVIGVHLIALTPWAVTVSGGALLTMLHVSREVFFLLTAFVLSAGYARRKSVRWLAFWRRRYLFVVVPYVVWTAVYFLADPAIPPTIRSSLHTLAYDLATGAARYHLYFLLVSMQIYLVFPLLRALVRRTAGHHRALLIGCAVFQLGCYAVAQSGWLAAYRDELLPSYLGFVIAGCVAGWHRDALADWTRRHAQAVFAGCAAALALGVGVFLAQVWLGGQSAEQASDVFQPVVVVESVAVAWAFLAIGLRWQDRGARGERIMRAGADASFGVYLVHPLLLQGVLAAATVTGLITFAEQQPAGLVVAVLLVVVAPLVYAASALFAIGARHTPVSLALTGRTREKREKTGDMS
jgi:peptidoglycan/LPS O-acetylase OafA/YrhL